METQETFKNPERKKKPEKHNVRREAEKMIRKHEENLKNLKETSLSTSEFRDIASKATSKFVKQLKTFLTKNGAAHLYEDLVGHTSDKVDKIVEPSSAKKT